MLKIVGCFVDANVRADVIVGQFTELFQRVEREIQQWVKAAVESSLGKLGTVGALAVEEFLGKLKGALQELGQSSFSPCVGDVLPRSSSVAGSVAGLRVAGHVWTRTCRHQTSVNGVWLHLVLHLPLALRRLQNLVMNLTRSCEGVLVVIWGGGLVVN